MNETILILMGIRITGWKLMGYLGVLMFTSRWFVQLHYSKKKGYSAMPALFWLMSIAGSFFCLMYFLFGKNDSVGIISYFFPMTVAGYNLYLNRQHEGKKKQKEDRGERPAYDLETPESCSGVELRDAS